MTNNISLSNLNIIYNNDKHLPVEDPYDKLRYTFPCLPSYEFKLEYTSDAFKEALKNSSIVPYEEMHNKARILYHLGMFLLKTESYTLIRQIDERRWIYSEKNLEVGFHNINIHTSSSNPDYNIVTIHSIEILENGSRRYSDRYICSK